MFFKGKPLLDFRHCCKLSWYAISRKTNDPNLRKMTKNLVPVPILASLTQSWVIIFFSKFCFCQSLDIMHCMKSVRIRSFSGPYFPAFGLNTDRYSVSLRIQSECRKMRSKKALSTHFCRAVMVNYHHVPY